MRKLVGAAGAGVVLLAGLTACGNGGGRSAPAGASVPAAVESTTASNTRTPLPPGSSVDPVRVQQRAVRMLFIGTSLTAGLGLEDVAQAWPGQIGQIADSLGYRVEVVNAGLSGETSAGALRRADWLLRDTADVVVIETGANDGLRGLSPAQVQANLEGLIAKVRGAMPKAALVVVQMEAPPNLGAAYVTAFRGVFPTVAKAAGATLAPFLLEGVAGVPGMNQPDGIHPTVAGARRAALNLWPTLRGVLDRVSGPAPAV